MGLCAVPEWSWGMLDVVSEELGLPCGTLQNVTGAEDEGRRVHGLRTIHVFKGKSEDDVWTCNGTRGGSGECAENPKGR